jgi:hypothetical protein
MGKQEKEITSFLTMLLQQGIFQDYSDVFDLKIVTEELVRKHRIKYINE